MPAESDSSIDAAQSQLAEYSNKEKEVKDVEYIFKAGGLVDNFQGFATSLGLENSPAAMKIFEDGKNEVSALMLDMAARGKYLIDHPPVEGGQPPPKAGEIVNSDYSYEKGSVKKAASSLLDTLEKYRVNLVAMSDILKKRKESLKSIMNVMGLEARYKMKEVSKQDYIQALDEALNGPDGAGGLCGIWKLINNSSNLPPEFITETNQDWGKNRIKDYAQRKVEAVQEMALEDEVAGHVGQNYYHFIRIEKPEKEGGEATLSFTEEGEKLPDEEKQQILLKLAGIRIQVEEKIEADTCLKVAESFWAGKAFFEAGKAEEAEKSLKKFRDEDIKSSDFQNNKELKAKEKEYLARTNDMLDQISKVTEGNQDFFQGQALAQAGDIYTAKQFLNRYIKQKSEEKDKKEGEKDFTDSAKELLKRIALTQLEQVKARFATLKAPERFAEGFEGIAMGSAPVDSHETKEYVKYQKIKKAIADMEEGIKSGLYLDFDIAYQDLKIGDDWSDKLNVFSDELSMEACSQSRSGKCQGTYLELARKYRKGENYALAEQYFQMYFGNTYKKAAEKELTMEDMHKHYDTNVNFHSAIYDKVKEAREFYDEQAEQDPEWAKKHPFDEAGVQKELINQGLQKLWPLEIERYHNGKFQVDPSSIGGVEDQAAWSEYMNMKGMHGQGKLWEPFAMSDEQMNNLVRTLPVNIALIAVSGGLGGVAGEFTSGVIMRMGMTAVEREVLQMGVSSALRQFASYAGGLLIENSVFTLSSSVLNGIRSGHFSVTDSDAFFEEWSHSLETLGLLGWSGRASNVLKFGRVSSFSLEMGTMAAQNGQLTLDDLGMVLGLKIGHGGVGKIAKQKAVSEYGDILSKLYPDKTPDEINKMAGRAFDDYVASLHRQHHGTKSDSEIEKLAVAGFQDYVKKERLNKIKQGEPGEESSSTSEKSETDAWTKELDETTGRLDQLPTHKQNGFTIETKNGSLTAEVVMVNSAECNEAGKGDLLLGNVANNIYYMFIKNATGEVIATRISSVFHITRGKETTMVVKSKIDVRDKGKGLATPVDVMFSSLLQNIADQNKLPVKWEVYNENKDKLEDYANSPNPDPVKLEQMKKEQERWMALYGPGGKFGIEKGGKTFTPNDKQTVADIEARTGLKAKSLPLETTTEQAKPKTTEAIQKDILDAHHGKDYAKVKEIAEGMIESTNTELSGSEDPKKINNAINKYKKINALLSDIASKPGIKELREKIKQEQHRLIMKMGGPKIQMAWDIVLAETPVLSKIGIELGNVTEDGILAHTAGFFRVTDFGEAGVTIMPLSREHYEKLLETRKDSVAQVAGRLGISVESITPEILRTFIILHELGHAQDYMSRGIKPAEWREMLAKERDTLPVPGQNPATLLNAISDKTLKTETIKDPAVRKLAEKALAGDKESLDQLSAIQQKAYKELPSEKTADDFATHFILSHGKEIGLVMPAPEVDFK